jgi:putative copper export protein
MAVDLLPAAHALARTLIYLATIWVIGALTVAAFIVPRASDSAGISLDLTRRVWRWATWGTVAVLAAYALRFYLQILDTYQTFWPTWHHASMLLFWTLGWGKGVLAQFAVAVVVCAWVRRASRRTPNTRAVAGVILLIGMAIPMTGHAIAHGGILATMVQGVHVAAIGIWLGSLAVVVTAWRSGALASGDLPAVVLAFSVYARWAVVTLAVTGVASLFVHLDAPGDVVRTPYGVVLFAKLVAFAAAAAMGCFHWRRVASRLNDPVVRSGFRHTVVVELACGLIAAILVGILSGMPRPGDLLP